MKIPKTPEAWLQEIAKAYRDALETMQFGKLTENKIEEREFFHLAPSLCLKFRGIKTTEDNLKMATESALSSFVATKDTVSDFFEIPQMAFAFCYLASHFGLDLVDKSTLSEAMGYIESRLGYLIKITTLD
ncbi:MAG: hypothetical protein JSW04_03240 [Desulfobacterales bacterium]|nr:MAG: hypothetical protein JSW04_03240 [Desulfobacterales bacterium]